MPRSRAGFRTVFSMEAFDGGLNTRHEVGQIDRTESPDCLNVVFDDRTVRSRQGSSALNPDPVGSFVCDGLYTANYSNENQSLIAFFDDSAYVLSGTSFVTIGSSQGNYNGGEQVNSTMYQDVIFFGAGNEPYKYNGTDFTRHGVDEAGNTISAVTGGTAGGNLSGVYSYKVAYVNSYAAVGDLSSAAVTVTAAAEDVVLTSIPVAPQSFGVSNRLIYRTDDNGAVYKLIGNIADNTTTTFNDNVASISAGAEADLDAGKPPNWVYAVTMQDRIFCVDNQNRSFLYYSNLGSVFIFKSTSVIRVNRDDGESITGLGVHSNALMIYKSDYSVWALYMPSTDDTTWVLIKTNANYGCGSHRSIVSYAGSQIYLGMKGDNITGFYALTGNLNEPQATNFISSDLFGDDRSDRIEDDIFDIQESFKANVSTIEFKNKLYFTLTKGVGETQNNRIYLYDFHKRERSSKIIGAWSPWEGLNIAQFAIFEGKLYGGSSIANGIVYEIEDGSYSDSGQAYNSYFWTKEFDEVKGHRDHEKDFRTAHFEVENSGDFDMGIIFRTDSENSTGDLTRVNLDAGGSNWGTLIWGIDNWDPGKNRKNTKILLKGARGKRIQFRFDNRNTAGSWFKVIRGRCYYNLRGLR